VQHRLDGPRVRAVRVARYDAIVLSETPVPADPGVRATLLRDAWLARQPDAGTAQLLRRIRFAKLDVDLPVLVGQAAAAAETLDEMDVEAQLPFAAARALAERAPASLVVPSGRTKALDYGEDGSVSLPVKLQELFGLAESPRLGPDRVPVTFHLLAPNGRPVQTTRDLRSFWERTYPEVRKELRGRYPKHPWPEDPWAAPPTHRTRRL
jgi:ATP-dependent helicase HrpB